MDNLTDNSSDSLQEPFLFDPLSRSVQAILYFLCLLYITLALWILVKHFLLPSLDMVIYKTAATPSIGGSLIIGGATTVLPLITAIIAVIIEIGDVSFGSIIGGHVYNHTVLAALVILITPKTISESLGRGPLLRDLVFVLITTIVLILFFVDSNIVWWESVLLMALFLLYIITVRVLRHILSQKLPESQENEPKPEVSTPLTLSLPSSCTKKALHIISLPIKVIFMFTIPDPYRESWRKFYPLTIIISILYLGLLSYFTVIVASEFGRSVGLPGEITGILIAPISIDFISSVILAKRGDLTLAIHSILGRAIITNTLILSIPWFIYTIVFNSPVIVSLSACSAFFSIFLLMAMIFLFLESVFPNKLWALPLILIFILQTIIAIAFSYEFLTCPV